MKKQKYAPFIPIKNYPLSQNTLNNNDHSTQLQKVRDEINRNNTNAIAENFLRDNQILFEPLENQVIPEVWSEWESLKKEEIFN